MNKEAQDYFVPILFVSCTISWVSVGIMNGNGYGGWDNPVWALISTYEHAWTLTKKGAKLVSDRPPRWHQSRFLLEHDTQLTALRPALENIGVAQSWVPEHEIRFKVASVHGLEEAKDRLIPDGIRSVNWKNTKVSLAIELELHSKEFRRYLRNFYQYKYKKNILGVWYLTSTSSLARTIEKLRIKEVGAERKPFFYWSLIDEVIKKPSEALVHSGRDSVFLHKLWGPNLSLKTAQVPAHTPSKENMKSQLNLS